MRPQQLLREQAIRFLKEQALIAYFALMTAVLGLGFLLNSEEVATGMLWIGSISVLETVSLGLRYFNPVIFKTLDWRDMFGRIMNFIDGVALSSILLYVPQVSSGTAAFFSAILLLSCAGCTMTSAGYKPLLWSFTGPILVLQVTAFSYYFFELGTDIYAVAALMALFTFGLVAGLSKSTGDTLLAAIEARLNAERAHQSKTRFFMASSHDLRQPVAATAAFIASAQKLNLDPLVSTRLKQAKEAVDTIDSQLSPMMELARIDSEDIQIRPGNLDLLASLKSVISLFHARTMPDVSLKLELPDGPTYCETDSKLLERVILNLIDNSVKYTHQGEIAVKLARETKHLNLTIRDTGIGIASEELDLIFDEFYQINNKEQNPAKGFGLGLPIAKRICSKLGIQFKLISKLGEFTQAQLLIPIKMASNTV